MQYLAISNPGVADFRGFTTLGISTTRNAGHADTIGQFGSGSKLSIALLLRLGIEPVVVCGNLSLRFGVKTETVKGRPFRRVTVKFDGKDLDGNSHTRTDDLGFTLEWGTQDWNKPAMAMREFVSNAIDGAIIAGASFRAVKFEVVDKIRKRSGETIVYLPYTDVIEQVHKAVPEMFLHIGSPELLEKTCIPKRFPGTDTVLIYKKGVLVNSTKGKSVFDYNLGDELTLDESRNASDWDVKYSVGKALRKESAENIASILKEIIAVPNLWEGKLDPAYLSIDPWVGEDMQKKSKEVFKKAWNAVVGDKSVVSGGNANVASFVEAKGFSSVVVPDSWVRILESYDVPNEKSILTRSEIDGKVVSDATSEMLSCTQKVWSLIEQHRLSAGKPIPFVKSYTSNMDGGGKVGGYFIPGGNEIFLHSQLGGKMMFKVCLEECVHYATGSLDGSRDIQDILFSLITEMAF